MNLAKKYKQLFEGKVRSNDAALLNEAEFDDNQYDKGNPNDPVQSLYNQIYEYGDEGLEVLNRMIEESGLEKVYEKFLEFGQGRIMGAEGKAFMATMEDTLDELGISRKDYDLSEPQFADASWDEIVDVDELPSFEEVTNMKPGDEFLIPLIQGEFGGGFRKDTTGPALGDMEELKSTLEHDPFGNITFVLDKKSEKAWEDAGMDASNLKAELEDKYDPEYQ